MKHVFAIQAWDQLNSRWLIPFCDLPQYAAKAVVQRWIQDLVCRNQMPLWALDNYTQAAAEEGETFLRRNRVLCIYLRRYPYVDGNLLKSLQTVTHGWIVCPDYEYPESWRAARLHGPDLSPKAAMDEVYSTSAKSAHLTWLNWLDRKALPWELRIPKAANGQSVYHQTR